MTGQTGDGLLPCPFCGGSNLKSGGDDKVVGIWCLTCEASGPNHYGKYDWNTRTPTRDGADGANNAHDEDLFALDHPERIYAAAPPKPAPDAMREALERVHVISLTPIGRTERLSITEICDTALSAPVPPADALRQNADRAHDKLYGFVPPADVAPTDQSAKLALTAMLDCIGDPDKTDHDVARILCDNESCIRQFARRASFPSPAVAAEPVAWPLEQSILGYARDLRRNVGGSDDYPSEVMNGVANYLEILVARSRGDLSK